MSKFNARKKYEKIGTGGGGEGIRRMKIVPGVSIVRIVEDNFENAWVHHFKDKEGKLRRAICLGKSNCPICESGNKASKRYYFNVIDRKEQKQNGGEFKVKLMEVGTTIATAIKSLALDDEYGDPTQYNIKIEREGEGFKDTKYNVKASPKRYAIKEEEEKIINKQAEEGGAYDLNFFVAKQTRAELLEILGVNDNSNKDDEDTNTVDEDEDVENDDEEKLDLDKELKDLEDLEDEEDIESKNNSKGVKEENDDDEEEEW